MEFFTGDALVNLVHVGLGRRPFVEVERVMFAVEREQSGLAARRRGAGPSGHRLERYIAHFN